MSEAFSYRVKYHDIRVRPPGGRGRAGASTSKRVCEHKSCDLPGDHRAPKRGGGDHWFCQRHAGEYNRSWNFFDDMTEAEVASFNEAERTGHKRTWKFGTGPVGGAKAAHMHDPKTWRGRAFFEDGAQPTRARQKPGRTRLQIRALDELDLSPDANAGEIRARYAEYVRRFHPDSNGGDRSSEHKLARVIRAWKTLKAAGLTRD
ncbi:MAG: J domain-containing protein [Pseudomonadota bacterium]